MINKIKRLTSLVLLVSILTVSFACVSAKTTGWTFENASESDGVFTLNGMVLDRNDEIVSDGGKIKTSVSDIGGKIVLITMESTHKTGTQLVRAASSSRNAKELLKISNGKITAFGNSNLATCTESREYSIALVMDLSLATPEVALWIDGEIKFSGEYSNITSIDLDSAYFELINNGTDVWSVSDFNIEYPNNTFKLDITPADSEGVNADSNGKITVDFGIASETMSAATNFELYANDVKLDNMTVAPLKTGVEIVPPGGFVEGMTYDLKILQTTDFFGTATGAKEIRFYCVGEGYIFPELTCACEENFFLYQDEVKDIAFSSNKTLSKLEIYLNDVLSETITEEPYNYSFVEENTGTVMLKAIAYDEYGITDDVNIIIEIKENPKPVIEITGIEDGMEYFYGSFPEVTVSAADSDGIVAISYAVDGKIKETVNSESLLVDLGKLSGGEHTLTFTAEDMYGAKSEKSITVTLSSNSEMLLKSDDFSAYSGSQLPSNSWGMAQRGYIGYQTIKEEFGKSLIVGMDTVNESYLPNNSAYVGLETQDCQTRVKIELDVYIDEKPGFRRNDPQGNTSDMPDNFVLLFKKNGANEKQIANFQNDKVYILDTPVSYSAKTWYHFVIDLDVGHHKVSATVSGDDINQTFTSDLDSGINVINYLRIIGPVYDEVKTFIAVDNFVLTKGMSLPVISVSGNVEPDTEEIKFNISEELMLSDLNTENITLTDEFGTVIPLKNIKAEEKAITLYPETGLKAATTYILTLSGECRYSSGEAVGLSVEGSFTTETGEFAILDGSFSAANFEITAVNTGEDDIKACAIMQVWNGNKVKTVKVEPFTIVAAPIENTYNVVIPTVAKGEKLTVYIWDGITSPKALTSEIFTFTK